MKTDKIEIYSDGSYVNGRCGFGAVILKKGEIIIEFSGPVNDEVFASHRQVGGELLAVMHSLAWCSENDISEVTIYYDYIGVENWAKGSWKTNVNATKKYSAFMKKIPVKVNWVKVPAHSGNKWNDYADSLAKKGAYKEELVSLNIEFGSDDPVVKKDPLVEECISAARAFSDVLSENGIDSENDGVFNGMFCRLSVFHNNKKAGIVDVYNTAKKRLSPDFRAFKNDEFLNDIKTLWEAFKAK